MQWGKKICKYRKPLIHVIAWSKWLVKYTYCDNVRAYECQILLGTGITNNEIKRQQNGF